jgi:nuclear transport factor 2 (NTF2) superfamily protein
LLIVSDRLSTKNSSGIPLSKEGARITSSVVRQNPPTRKGRSFTIVDIITNKGKRAESSLSNPPMATQESKTQGDVAPRPPLPPFTRETAIQKVRLAEDGWNSRDPEKVALAYTIDSRWRNRAEFPRGREEIIQFLRRKWAKELDYRLIKELWAFTENRIAVRFAYEWHDDSGNWFRSYGTENWEFADDGLMRFRHASINDLPIKESERKYHWPLGRRPDGHPGLSELGL